MINAWKLGWDNNHMKDKNRYSCKGHKVQGNYVIITGRCT